MKDNEIYSCKEFNDFHESNNSYKESFSVVENRKVNEDYSIKEENEDNVTSNQQEIKKQPIYKDRIIESTGPFRTIVSAATCTVAATVAVTTTFLVPPPGVDQVQFECGNDYVKYALNINDLDTESSYQINVNNANFDYTEPIDLTKADSLGYINGFVEGLKPNRRYDFKLMRDNGEIGGYSEFFTKSFYTLKAKTPDVLFDFKLDNNILNYDIKVSDYYDICENTYLVEKNNGQTINQITIDNKSLYFNIYK